MSDSLVFKYRFPLAAVQQTQQGVDTKPGIDAVCELDVSLSLTALEHSVATDASLEALTASTTTDTTSGSGGHRDRERTNANLAAFTFGVQEHEYSAMGLHPWPCGVVLAEFLARNPRVFLGATVIEVRISSRKRS